MPIECDYHMHTPLCRHAAGPMEAYIERGIELGLREIGFSDHCPLPRGLGGNVRMQEAELGYYVNEVLRLRGEYFGKIEVMLGLEMDFLDGLENYCRDLIARYPWDYIIGSVHYLDTACRLGAWPKNCGGDIGAHYKRYFEQLRKLARSGICDIIAHFDIPRRTGQDPTAANAADIADTLREIANAGLSLEINTSGYRHAELPHPAPYPNFPIIKEAIALGIPMTVNSDSHDPQHVGWKFAEIELFLRRNSCEQLARYERRKRVMYDL